MSWKDIEVPGKTLSSRYGHTALLLPPSTPTAKPATVVLFGGRNTNKKYFNDLYTIDLRTYLFVSVLSGCTSALRARKL